MSFRTGYTRRNRSTTLDIQGSWILDQSTEIKINAAQMLLDQRRLERKKWHHCTPWKNLTSSVCGVEVYVIRLASVKQLRNRYMNTSPACDPSPRQGSSGLGIALAQTSVIRSSWCNSASSPSPLNWLKIMLNKDFMWAASLKPQHLGQPQVSTKS